MGCFVGSSVASLVGLDELATSSSYYFKYYLPDRVFNIGEATWSAAKADSSSESVREMNPSSVSLEETLITLQ